MVKDPPASVRDLKDSGLIPGLGRPPGGGPGDPFQYSCLKNPAERRPWWATVRGVTKRQTQLKQLGTHAKWQEYEQGKMWLQNLPSFFLHISRIYI